MNGESLFEDEIVGLLTSTSRGLSIGTDPKSNSLHALITIDQRSNFRLEEYLRIPLFDKEGTLDENLLCKITELAYYNEFPHEFSTYDVSNLLAEEMINQSDRIIQEIDYNFVATLQPLSLINNGQRGPPNRLPPPASKVYKADKDTIKIGLKLSQNLHDIFIGYLTRSPPGQKISYLLKDRTTDPLLFTHVLVAGGTGSGKTQTTKNILRQCLGDQRTYNIDGSNKKLAIVQFDPQDEYAQMFHDPKNITEEEQLNYENNKILFGKHEATRVFVPTIKNTQYTSEYHDAETTSFTIPFSLVEQNPWLIARGDLNELQMVALTDILLPNFFHSTTERECTYSNFLTYLAENEDEYTNGKSNKTNIATGTFSAIKRKVNGFSNVFFDGTESGYSPPITDLINDFVKPGQLSVVPISHINNHRDSTFVVLALSSLLIDEKITSSPEYERIKQTPLILSMDEAHNFLSKGHAEIGQEDVLIQKFIHAAKQGRKEKLGLFLVTQDPHDIAGDILTQIGTKIILNLSDDSAIKSLNLPSDLKWKIPNLTVGNMVVHSPSYTFPSEVTGLPNCLVRHEH